MGEVAPGSAYCSKRYAGRANGAFIDGITRVGSQ